MKPWARKAIKFKISLTKQILLAILLGSFLGVLLGPLCSVFEPIGKAFIMFIQMVILLYIPSSIIHGLGSTRPTVARTLLKKGWIFFLFIWLIVLSTVYLLNLLFPRINILFSGTGAHSSFEANFLNYLVPENPVYDLVNNIVPAIAIFAIIIGIAVMHLTHKEPLISLLERVNSTMEQILKGITIVSPIGIFAIFANFAGKIQFHELYKLNFYIIPMIVIALVLSFWLLPALVISCTPLKFREVIRDIRSSCFLAFVIGSPSIAIPFLYKTVNKHAEQFDIKDKELHNTAQMIVPITYTFTQVGNLFILFFIMFLSYYFSSQLEGFAQTLIGFMSIIMSFGGPELAINSISFLTSTLGFPDTAMDIYDNASIITQNFQILISVASMVTFVTLLLLAYYKRLSFNASLFFRHFFTFFLLLTISVFATKYLLQEHRPEANPSANLTIQTDYPIASSAKVYKIGEKLPPDIHSRRSDIGTLERIYATNTLYVGYHPTLPPFSYFNSQGELVGYNITFAYKLAHDMGVHLVFIPFLYENLGIDLRSNSIDIAMSPILLADAKAGSLNFPHYYLSTPNVLIVSRMRKEEFRNFQDLKKNPYLTIGVIGFYQEVLDRILPKAQAVPVEHIEHINHLLTTGKIDAVFWTKEQGIEYCRSHPDYVVMDYGSQAGNSFLAYPVKYDAFAFIFFLNRWMTIQENIGFSKEQYQYWMLGQPPQKKEPRWSLMRNVFHLIK
ncbi:MAG: cation:dicarboxylase symporter family transporter [Chlamydiia bacterium]|nr:cation:dicarboxylase symporter family transporter [Chlamydiia bacterium]